MLDSFVKQLKNDGELIEIDNFVNPDLQITEIADRYSKQPNGGKALLFNNNGTDFPLLINAFGSENRICKALGISNVDEFSNRISSIFTSFQTKPKGLVGKLKIIPQLISFRKFIPRKIKGRGACQAIINKHPNLNQLPILTCWPFDGGRFITLPIVHTVDPDTGIRNVGMYRMQQFSETETGMHWHKHKVGARHYEAYKSKGLRMPVSVVLGGDPVYTYAATAPVPDNFDEYVLAGFIRNRPVKLVKCITNDLFVPEDADIVLEGYIDTSEDLAYEGPFGDHTGFYSLADYYPRFHVTCITHRKNAIFPATIVGVPPMEDAYLGLVSEKLFLKPLQIGIAPDVVDMHMPVAGVVHNLVIVSAKISYEGQAFKIANALWGAGQMMFTKYVIVVDESIDIRDYRSVWAQIINHVDFQKALLFSKGPLDVLDHSSDKQSVGGKLAIDATTAVLEKPKYTLIAEDVFQSMHFAHVLPGLVFVFTTDPSAEILQLKKKLTTEVSGVIVFVEPELENLNLYTIAWYVLGNTDPHRDIELVGGVVIIDGLKKSGRDNFTRPWPDLVVMSDSVISEVDEMWPALKIGELIPSPSLPFKGIAKEMGAEL